MSRRKKSRQSRASQESDDDDDDDDDDYQNASQSQGKCPLTPREVKKLAKQICNLLLVGEIKKIPVKKSEMTKHIIQNKSRTAFLAVMEEAKKNMRDVTGFEIVALPDNSFILTNTLSPSLVKLQKCTLSETNVRGLLINILAVIFMYEGRISAKDLDSFLRILEIDMKGQVDDLIKNLTKTRYLKTENDDSTDPPTKVFRWGERAEAEFPKKRILEYVCEVYGNMRPSMWTHQWKAVNGEGNGE